MLKMKKTVLSFTLLIMICFWGFGQKNKLKKEMPLSALQLHKKDVSKNLDDKFGTYAAMSKQIWDWAELGYLEENSSKLLQEKLRTEGFTIQAGVAGIPTAFVATYGSGAPSIAILAEYDALPGLAQDNTPELKPIVNQKAGHGCGHNLFGVASVAAAIEIKNALQSSKKSGTIQLFGCPAEEGGSGKVYLVRENLFANTDIALHWHPGSQNSANAGSSLANMNGKFRFKGIASHAAASPERGRSALDGVEAMNMMANMMREHIPSDSRMHYVITKGGEAPNVVPANAEVYYYVRHRNPAVVKSVWERLENAAKGAALGTGTTVEWEVLGGVYDILPNKTLAEVMYKNLTEVGGVIYSETEKAFAIEMAKSFTTKNNYIEKAAQIAAFKSEDGVVSGGSTDVGDVSWVVPTVGLSTATWVPGTGAHSWQSTACSGMSIGHKGMINAAKTLAYTALDLISSPKIIEKAKNEFNQNKPQDFKYQALLGNRKPALDYRK